MTICGVLLWTRRAGRMMVAGWVCMLLCGCAHSAERLYDRWLTQNQAAVDQFAAISNTHEWRFVRVSGRRVSLYDFATST